MKKLSMINKNMTEEERAEYLKEKEISIVEAISNDEIVEIMKYEINLLQKVLIDYSKSNNIFKEYKDIGDTRLSALFSVKNLKESIHKSSDYKYMPTLIFNLSNILKNSIKIEEHSDIKMDVNINGIHELLGFLLYENNLLTVKTTIKELDYSKTGVSNSIYTVANFEIKKVVLSLPQTYNHNYMLEDRVALPIYKLTQLLQYVNSGAILKYIPNSLLNDKQIEIKNNAILDFRIKHYKDITT